VRQRIDGHWAEKGDIGRIHCSVSGLARWHDRSTTVSGHRLEQAAGPAERANPYQLKEWSETDCHAFGVMGQVQTRRT
jgi:hypothetical protein